ncbi:MAG: class I SAM-dependent methyltransferase [Chloroflexota bacterium]
MTTGIDQTKLDQFLEKAVTDLGAGQSAALAYIGDRLGLYQAMAGAGPMTASELADRTSTRERYIREWLNNQAAGGYVTYDPGQETYELPDEHAIVLADEGSPVYLSGLFELTAAMWAGTDKIEHAFRTGAGVPWGAHDSRLFAATERTFSPQYQASLTSEWIPALEGVEEKLNRGAAVADVGCGHGASTILMAKAYPNSRFFGFDNHEESIATAREAARVEGVEDRVTFSVSDSAAIPERGFDLLCFFDCLHDMGDPVGAASQALEALKQDGAVMLVEPYANDRTEDNFNPVGRLFYAASTFLCTPSSLSQEVGLGLGAQAGESRLRDVFHQAGFTRFRRATETPFNLIFEAKP